MIPSIWRWYVPLMKSAMSWASRPSPSSLKARRSSSRYGPSALIMRKATPSAHPVSSKPDEPSRICALKRCGFDPSALIWTHYFPEVSSNILIIMACDAGTEFGALPSEGRYRKCGSSQYQHGYALGNAPGICSHYDQPYPLSSCAPTLTKPGRLLT